jgi:hypothetical protein
MYFAIPLSNDVLELCLQENDDLITSTLMTSSVIMNKEMPDERGGLAHEYYVNLTVSAFLYNSCPLRSVGIYCQMAIIINVQTERCKLILWFQACKVKPVRIVPLFIVFLQVSFMFSGPYKLPR